MKLGIYSYKLEPGEQNQGSIKFWTAVSKPAMGSDGPDIFNSEQKWDSNPWPPHLGRCKLRVTQTIIKAKYPPLQSRQQRMRVQYISKFYIVRLSQQRQQWEKSQGHTQSVRWRNLLRLPGIQQVPAGAVRDRYRPIHGHRGLSNLRYTL